MRKLSKNDPNRYRVCDDCDNEMTNWEARVSLKKKIDAKDNMAKLLSNQIEEAGTKNEEKANELEKLKIAV